jgi:hypothetical protein
LSREVARFFTVFGTGLLFFFGQSYVLASQLVSMSTPHALSRARAWEQPSMALSEEHKSPFPNDVNPPSCPHCGVVMQLARTQPAYFYKGVL